MKGPRNCRSLRALPHGSPGRRDRSAFAPNDTGRADDWLSAAPTALGSSSGSISQPFRAGLTFGGRPSGPCIYADLCHVISPSTCPGQVSCSHGTLHGEPGQAGQAGRQRRGRGSIERRLPDTGVFPRSKTNRQHPKGVRTRPFHWTAYSGAVLSFPTAFDVDSVPPPKRISVDRAGGFYGNHPR